MREGEQAGQLERGPMMKTLDGARIVRTLVAGVFATIALSAPSADAALRVIPAGEPNGFISETSSTQAGSAADDTVSFNLDPQPVGFIAGGLLKDTVVDLPP